MSLAGYKKTFIDFAIEQGVMKFGEFELKSGRISPYFFDAGAFKTGAALWRLGEYYAEALIDSGIQVDCLFGPAYKGIPLVAATAIAMSMHHHRDLPYAFNRKEAKDHGEGGVLVGAGPAGNVVIVDDVITAGTATREAMGLIAGKAKVVGIVIAIDRRESGKGALSAIQEIERDYGVRVISVVNLDEVIEYLTETGGFTRELAEISAYRARYGISPAGGTTPESP